MEEKQEEEDLKNCCIKIEENETPNLSLFRNRFERYEHLIKKSKLDSEQKSWVKNYEQSEEYQQIYEKSEVSNL